MNLQARHPEKQTTAYSLQPAVRLLQL